MALIAIGPSEAAGPDWRLRKDATICITVQHGGIPTYKPNRYPFRFLLSTRYQSTTNPRIRTAVYGIQMALTRLPAGRVNGTWIATDGSYGQQTEAAVRKYQRNRGLIVDGKVGPQTWEKLAGWHCKSGNRE